MKLAAERPYADPEIAARKLIECHSACNIGSDSHPMNFSAELVVLQRGNQRHASRYSNFVACAEWVGNRKRKRFI
jgi:hypothetical protein